MPIQRFEAKEEKAGAKARSGSRKQKSVQPARKKTWRENIEALTVAVLVALVLKGFVIEVSKIPSGSMQPTLMGSPAAGVFDRVIVDKLSFVDRDPNRFEVVVFRHPLERSRNMVKRLVGLPNEYFRIAGGDLWTRPDEDSEWSILRRPEDVQEEMWKELAPLSQVLSEWKLDDDAEGWSVSPDGIQARGDGVVRFRPDTGIRNSYLDGYAASIRERIVTARQRDPRRFGYPPGETPVGDIRLDGEIEATAGLVACEILLTEGRRKYYFRISGPADFETSNIIVTPWDSPQSALETSETELRLEAGKRVPFRVENLDDHVALTIDGELVAEAEVAPVENPVSTLSIRIEGEGAELSNLRVFRDIHYMPSRTGVSELYIPEGHYFVLGDNTLDSADGREWQSVTVELEEEDGSRRQLVANYRGNGENPSVPVVSEGQRVRFLRDEWGERYALPAETPGLDTPASFHLVSRDLIQGRALAVFWPIVPWSGIWRLGWIEGG